MERIIDQNQLRIKVNPVDAIFQIRLYFDNAPFEFIVCPTGTIYVDPRMLELMDGMRCGNKLFVNSLK